MANLSDASLPRLEHHTDGMVCWCDPQTFAICAACHGSGCAKCAGKGMSEVHSIFAEVTPGAQIVVHRDIPPLIVQ